MNCPSPDWVCCNLVWSTRYLLQIVLYSQMHVILDHYMEFFESFGETLLSYSDEICEAMHSQIRLFEDAHRYINNKKGSDSLVILMLRCSIKAQFTSILLTLEIDKNKSLFCKWWLLYKGRGKCVLKWLLHLKIIPQMGQYCKNCPYPQSSQVFARNDFVLLFWTFPRASFH